MDNGNVAEVSSLQRAIYITFGRSLKKLMTCISPGYILSLKFGWNWMEGSSSLLKMLTSDILQSALNYLKLNSKNQKWKVPYIAQYIGPQVTNVHPFRSTISHFQDIAQFRIFPLTPMLKFQSVTKFLIFARSPKSNSLY